MLKRKIRKEDVMDILVILVLLFYFVLYIRMLLNIGSAATSLKHIEKLLENKDKE